MVNMTGPEGLFSAGDAVTLTCRPLCQVEAVCMVHLRAAGLLAGDYLPTVTAGEALVLPLPGHLGLALPLHVDLLLLLSRLVLRRRLVLRNEHVYPSASTPIENELGRRIGHFVLIFHHTAQLKLRLSKEQENKNSKSCKTKGIWKQYYYSFDSSYFYII